VDPQSQFCPNEGCAARGQVGQGNIRVHSWLEHRYRCTVCRRTFAATPGTPFYRLQTAAATVTLVVTLLAHGCPLQAIVAAFGVDERTVARWQAHAGAHCQQVHEHLVQQGALDLGHVQADEVQQGALDLGHVQADELWIKVVGGKVWMALALAIPSRLGLGGVVSPHRDGALIATLVRLVRAASVGVGTGLLVCVDGLASYVTAFRRAFRVPLHTGRVGRPRLVLPDGFLLGQVVKQYAHRHVIAVAHRVIYGTPAAITAALAATGGGTVINTASIERLNATFRAHLAPLIRRGRALAHTTTVLTAGMYLVGCAYNLCWEHDSLRQAAATGAPTKWIERTPAMAAGLTDHCWTMTELLHYRVPLSAWVAPALPKRRGRPPKHRLTLPRSPAQQATRSAVT
jgi:transposase-like protein